MSRKVTPSRKTRPRGYIENYRPQAKTLALLADAKAVLEVYLDYWPLTVRQIYYRLHAAHGYPKDEVFYKRLVHHLANARRGRLIPFEAIRDDGVSVSSPDCYDSADAFLWEMRERARTYQRNLLRRQPVHIEVWCEAAGMVPQLARVAGRYSVKVYSCSGFDSVDAKKTLANRICEIGKRAVILHLGDYDPSGEDLFTAIQEDVEAFVLADRPHGLVSVEFRRVALTEQQVTDYALPTAPPKASDSRSKAWAGDTCQLEALAPDQIATLLEDAIIGLIDVDILREDVALEGVERARLTRQLLPGPGQGG